jgi:hypothetical protein
VILYTILCFRPNLMYVMFCFAIFWLWTYLMKVISDLQSFDFERTWWRLFQIYNLLTLNVPDEGYFRFTIFWLWTYLMKVISDLQSFDLERTWWRLFQIYNLLTLNVPDEGYFRFTIFWPWTYLMKVISETCRVHLFTFLFR